MRTTRLVLAAAAVAAAAVAGLSQPAAADPQCKLWWERPPSVDPANGTIDPGSEPMWVC